MLRAVQCLAPVQSFRGKQGTTRVTSREKFREPCLPPSSNPSAQFGDRSLGSRAKPNAQTELLIDLLKRYPNTLQRLATI
jgi:hypothetical protein